MTYFPPPWTPNEIPTSYERITWEDRQERTRNDYMTKGVDKPNEYPHYEPIFDEDGTQVIF